MTTIPAKTVVLTFDDAVKSHSTFVGPFLKDLGHRATFFVSQRWMSDQANFMSWDDIAGLHGMGFEIGNHSWTHGGFASPRMAARLEGELALVDYQLSRVKVPRPVSFAWPGNGFGPEAVRVVTELGYKFARRGGMPEVEYGRATVGPGFDPSRRHPLLIPTTGDSYPNWTFEHFLAVLEKAVAGQAVVLQFHGVPDVAHPWVHSDPALFRQYMTHLKDNGYRTLALSDLEPYVDRANPPRDPVLGLRNPLPPPGSVLAQPVEQEATRKRLGYWRGVMAAHGYSPAEVARVTGQAEEPATPVAAKILPYPGGRHPRIGFLNGAVAPMRGTKASVFLPWDPASYVVVDLPEAIIGPKGVLFLAHTHIPTIWDFENKAIDNVDWEARADGSLASSWTLPNKVQFAASLRPVADGVDMELAVTNGSGEALVKHRSQVCVMLKGAPEFAAQSNENKTLGQTRAVVRSAKGDRWISVEFDNCQRVWANPPCPCMHSDPWIPDCAVGQTVRVAGRLRWGTV